MDESMRPSGELFTALRPHGMERNERGVHMKDRHPEGSNRRLPVAKCTTGHRMVSTL